MIDIPSAYLLTLLHWLHPCPHSSCYDADTCAASITFLLPCGKWTIYRSRRTEMSLNVVVTKSSAALRERDKFWTSWTSTTTDCPTASYSRKSVALYPLGLPISLQPVGINSDISSIRVWLNECYHLLTVLWLSLLYCGFTYFTVAVLTVLWLYLLYSNYTVTVVSDEKRLML